MKQYLSYSIILSILLSIFFTSCKKYEEGPDFSLRSKNGRLTGKWTIKMASDTPLRPEEQETNFIEFEKDGEFSFNEQKKTATISLKGTWEWINKKEGLKIEIQGIEPEEWTILKLTKDDLWFNDNNELRWELEKR